MMNTEYRGPDSLLPDYHELLFDLPEASVESVLGRYDKHQLKSMLVVLESRLGTGAETPRDLENARTIAHQLNNLLLVEKLQTALSGRPLL